jgi:hypothetical protein
MLRELGSLSESQGDIRTRQYPSGSMGPDGGILIRDLIGFTAPWRSLYSHSAPIETSVLGTHVLSTLVAGGLALAHDRGTLRAGRWTAAIQEHHLDELHRVHRTIVIALALCMFSGLALFASDVKTYAVSAPFWIKMALIALLFANALVMTSSEGRLRIALGARSAAAWTRIRASSIVSAFLWLAIVFVSVVLSLSK